MKLALDGMDRVLFSPEVLLGQNKRSLILFYENKAGVAAHTFNSGGGGKKARN